MNLTICYFVTYLVEAIILWQYSSTLFDSKYNFKIRLAVLCTLYLILFFASLFDFKWLNLTLYFIANFIFFCTQFRIKWISAFFHSAVISATMALCELMVYGIMERFTPHFIEMENAFDKVIIFDSSNKIMFFTIICILIHLLKGRQNYSEQHDKTVFLLVFIPLTAMFVMLTFVGIIDTVTLSPTLDCMVAISAVFLLVINLLVFGINQYNQKKSTEFTEMQLLLQKESDSAEYYEMLRLQNENQSILIHDIKKHLQSIDLLNDQKEHDKISAYIRQLLLSSDLKEVSRLCDDEMLNSILCRYMRQCTDSHIAFHADIRRGTTDFIDDNDLTSLFCNLLDNALEAANNIPNAFVEIDTSKREKTPFVVITVINSCRKNPFSDQNDSLTTSKSDKRKHGFGLKSIRRVVNKYHGNIQMYYHDDTSTFHTVITLKQHKK